jgi:hypothetical protein
MYIEEERKRNCFFNIIHQSLKQFHKLFFLSLTVMKAKTNHDIFDPDLTNPKELSLPSYLLTHLTSKYIVSDRDVRLKIIRFYFDKK